VASTIALAAILLLFTGWWDKEQTTETPPGELTVGIPSGSTSSTLLLGVSTPESAKLVKGFLSNDADHDGAYDGMADPIGESASDMLRLTLPLSMLLMVLYRQQNYCFDDCSPLERPG
jgi:hypothetical protein